MTHGRPQTGKQFCFFFKPLPSSQSNWAEEVSTLVPKANSLSEREKMKTRKEGSVANRLPTPQVGRGSSEAQA
jgi:hypothetical protein